MSSTWDNADAICPFFETSGIKMVTCEGISEGNRLCILFNDTKRRLSWRRTFCDKRYEECEVYKMLIKKYEDSL